MFINLLQRFWLLRITQDIWHLNLVMHNQICFEESYASKRWHITMAIDCVFTSHGNHLYQRKHSCIVMGFPQSPLHTITQSRSFQTFLNYFLPVSHQAFHVLTVAVGTHICDWEVLTPGIYKQCNVQIVGNQSTVVFNIERFKWMQAMHVIRNCHEIA